MFRSLSIIGLLLLSSLSVFAQTQTSSLPELNKIKTATLSPAYSCRSGDDFKKGYEQTALFVTEDSRKDRRPELLFNGACGAADYFQSALGGDSFSLVADLGKDVKLEELSASRSFNLKQIASRENHTNFARMAPVVSGNTYAVLINEVDRRALIVFTITDHVPNKAVEIRYAVKAYQTLNSAKTSPGFVWEKGSSQ
ncbi:MAG: hypothetical protein ACT4O9_05355 [Blastocatellia bacterium]